jgi:hypothetical protein
VSLLLITATITPPPDAIKLARVDPKARLSDYAEALRFYIEVLERGGIDGVVFVENSNSDMSVLTDLASRSSRAAQIEFIGFQGLDYPPEHGRGYGEMRLLDHAMKTSALVAGLKDDAVVWKVTGRYVIRNIERLVRTSRGAEIYCQCRNYPLRWTDMYFMGWTRRSYAQAFGDAAERIKEQPGRPSSEVEFRRLVDEVSRSIKVKKRFVEPPDIVGVRGWDNQRYEAQRLKSWSRALLARIAPWIWI